MILRSCSRVPQRSPACRGLDLVCCKIWTSRGSVTLHCGLYVLHGRPRGWRSSVSSFIEHALIAYNFAWPISAVAWSVVVRLKVSSWWTFWSESLRVQWLRTCCGVWQYKLLHFHLQLHFPYSVELVPFVFVVQKERATDKTTLLSAILQTT